jgi:tRNA dimethylallyltransferase
MSCNLLVLLGATASGKTRLGVELARLLQGEIISADSRQVYRGMDLGTGKDLAEYGEVAYHLIDIVDPGYEFNVFEFQQRAFAAIEAIRGRGKLPLLVGGTGLYLDAVLRGYRLLAVPENPQLRAELADLDMPQLAARLLTLRPELHNHTDLTDRSRLLRAIEIAMGEAAAGADLPPAPDIQPLLLGLQWPREILRQRITLRLKERIAQGMIDEVAALHAAGVPWATLEFYGLEYRFIAQHLQGVFNRNDMTQKLGSAIHQFAKRQETWFRRMEKQGMRIHWLDGTGDALGQAMQVIGREPM